MDESLECSYPPWFRWLRMWRLLHALGFGLLCVLTIIFARLAVPMRSVTFLVGDFIGFAAWAIPASQLVSLPCPRCGRRFFWCVTVMMFIVIQFRSRCVSCGLPIYANDVPVRPET